MASRERPEGLDDVAWVRLLEFRQTRVELELVRGRGRGRGTAGPPGAVGAGGWGLILNQPRKATSCREKLQPHMRATIRRGLGAGWRLGGGMAAGYGVSRVTLRTLTLTHSLSHTRSHTLALTHSLSHTRSHTLALTHSLSHTRSHTLTLTRLMQDAADAWRRVCLVMAQLDALEAEDAELEAQVGVGVGEEVAAGGGARGGWLRGGGGERARQRGGGCT